MMVKAKIQASSAAFSASYCRRSLVALLTTGVSVFGCMTPAPAQFTDALFDQYQLDTGSSNRQTLLSGFLLDSDTAELAVVHIDDNDNRRLQIYGFDGNVWDSVLETSLGAGVRFVDITNIDGRDRLITYEDGRLNWFDPAAATERALMEISTHYNATAASDIPHLLVTRDLNHDGRDDLLIPDVDGFWVSTQSSDGVFTDPVKLGPAEPFRDEIAFGEASSYGEKGINRVTMPAYQSRVHELDYNQDGRSDLVFWNEDHFDVYYQDVSGTFSVVAETFTTDVSFGSDGVYSLAFGFSDASAFSLVTGIRSSSRHTALFSFQDMNGDGVADLITQSLQGRSLINLRSQYEVHFGSPTDDGLSFAPEVSMAIHPQASAEGGSPMDYSLGGWQDVDGDGQVEVMLGRVDTGIGGFFRAILASSISLDLEFYRLEDGIYPNQPNGELHVKPDFEFILGGRGPFFPTILVGDVSGDGRADLLVGENWEELHVYPGVPGQNVFGQQAEIVRVALTANGEEDARLADLNRDGKQDVLVNHPSSTEPQRIVVLLSK